MRSQNTLSSKHHLCYCSQAVQVIGLCVDFSFIQHKTSTWRILLEVAANVFLFLWVLPYKGLEIREISEQQEVILWIKPQVEKQDQPPIKLKGKTRVCLLSAVASCLTCNLRISWFLPSISFPINFALRWNADLCRKSVICSLSNL